MNEEQAKLEPLTEGEIMDLVRKHFPWKSNPKAFDELTYEKSPPMFPQATYTVPTWNTVAFVRDIEARASALSRTPSPAEGKAEPVAVKVLELEWQDRETQSSSALEPFGSWYFVNETEGGWRTTYADKERYSTREAAKAAAQADYSARILAALQLSPAPAVAAVPVAWRTSASSNLPDWWLFDTQEEAIMQFGGEFVQPLYAAPPSQAEPVAVKAEPFCYVYEHAGHFDPRDGGEPPYIDFSNEPKPGYKPLYLSPLSSAPEPGWQATHRHKKRGTEYVLIGYGRMQAEGWHENGIYNAVQGHSVDMREVAIYRSATDPTEIWVRPREEFEDGRFEALPATPSPTAEEK